MAYGMEIAFLGFGTIGRIIHSELTARAKRRLHVTACLDPALSVEMTRELAQQGVKRVQHLHELIRLRPDLVVEAASQEVARRHVPPLLAEGIDVLSMSAGAYLDPEVMAKIRDGNAGNLLIPSGALPGVDVLKAAAVRGITSAELTTRKNPRSLAGAPGARGINLETLQEARSLFSGPAEEAVRAFPENTNVAATLSLVGIGAQRTQVTVIADPNTDMNTHTVVLHGDFGSLTATIECLPSSNPKTSLVAALSAVAMLEGMTDLVHIGT